MQTLFTKVFVCCLRSTRKNQDRSDESSPLLPSIEPIIYGEVAVDRRQATEQLDGIVRSKHGKMVDVLSNMPFNLRNDPDSIRSHESSSHSNRSSLGNGFHASDLTGPSGSIVRRKAPESVSRSHSASPFPNASTTSVILETNEMLPEPILNARLVRNSVLHQIGNSRGRARGRTRQLENNGRSDVLQDSELLEPATADENELDYSSTTDIKVHVESFVMHETTEVKDDGQRVEFQIHDIGDISYGWGD